MILSNEYQYIGRSSPLVAPANYEYYLLLYAKTAPETATGIQAVTVKMRLAANVNTAFYDWATTGLAKVAGVQAFAWESKAVPDTNWDSWLTEDGITYPRWVDLKEGTALVPGCFGADREVALEASWVLDYSSGAGWLPPAGEAATFHATVTLPGIEGPTVPAAEGGELGKALTIRTPALVSGARHTLRYRFGSAEGLIAEDAGESCTWTPPLDLARQIPNSTTGTAVITCQTFLNGQLFGTPQETAVLLTVPDSVVPTASATWEDTSGALDELGVYAKGVSKLGVSVTGTGIYGSTVTGAAVTLDGKGYTGGILTSTGERELVVTVTDSRGRSGSQKYTILVADYEAPTLTLAASRCDGDGNPDDMGEYAKVTVTGRVSAVGSNRASLRLTWGAEAETAQLAPGEVNFSKTVPAPSTAAMAVTAALSDALFTAPATMTLSVGYATMDFLQGGKGIAFGTTATQEGFTCAMPARFTGGVSGVTPYAESESHPGCFCRQVDSETEWLNPPMAVGTEYRTAERYLGNPVYVCRKTGQLANNSHSYITGFASKIDRIVDFSVMVKNDDGSTWQTQHPNLKVTVCTDPETSASRWVWAQLTTTGDLTAYTAEVTVKYTKR